MLRTTLMDEMKYKGVNLVPCTPVSCLFFIIVICLILATLIIDLFYFKISMTNNRLKQPRKTQTTLSPSLAREVKTSVDMMLLYHYILYVLLYYILL